MVKLRLSILFLLGVLSAIVNSQSVFMEKVSSQDGLFSDRFFKTYRDNQGYLWVVGINGVARYDGRYILNFTENRDTSKYFIKGERFFDVTQDNAHNIWVGGESGLYKYDIINNRFSSFATDRIKKVSFLYALNDSILFISSSKGNFHLNIYNNEITKLKGRERVSSIQMDHSGLVWKATSKGILVCNEDTVLKLHENINDFCFTPNNEIYIASNNGLYIFHLAELTRKENNYQYISSDNKPFSLSHNNVTSLAYLNGSVWAGTRNGLNRVVLDSEYDISGIQFIFNEPNYPFSLSNNQITDIYVDKEEIIWISTYGGLNKLDLQHQWFSNFRHNPQNPYTIHDNSIYPVYGDTLGNVWFGSFRSGMSRLNVNEEQFTRYNTSNGFDINSVFCIYTDHKNQTLLTADHSLKLADGNELIDLELLDEKNHAINFKQITSVIQHPNGNYWMCVDRKLVELKQVSKRQFQVQRINKENNISVICFFIDNEKRIWVGTSNKGVIVINAENNKIIAEINKKTHEVLKINEIQTISQDTKGNIWLGSVNGLYKIDKLERGDLSLGNVKIKGFFEQDGLTHNYVSAILPDKNGELWLGTWKGIIKYNPNALGLGRFIPYAFSDGLVDVKYNRRGAYLDTISNTYYFSSVNGVNYFKPVKKYRNIEAPHVLIHQLIADGDTIHFPKSYLKKAMDFEFQKDGKINQLLIEYGSSSLLSPGKQVFAWKLQGRDETWNYTRNRELSIKDLNSGLYNIHIKAALPEGEFGQPIHISVRVSSGSWIVLVVVFLVFLVVLVLTILYIKQQRKIKQSKRENKYVFSKLTDDITNQAIERLTEVMTNDKPYLQKNLSVEKLAQLINVSSGELSQIFNEHLNTRFYEYINKYRVEEFIRLLKTSDAEILTLNALAEKSGFSSKSTFYRAFNKEKEMTPAQFVKSFAQRS